MIYIYIYIYLIFINLLLFFVIIIRDCASLDRIGVIGDAIGDYQITVGERPLFTDITNIIGQAGPTSFTIPSGKNYLIFFLFLSI